MSTDTRFSKAFSKCQDSFSTDIRIRYFNQYQDDVYDDSFSLTQSGNDIWCNGTIQSLDTTQGSTDANLVEQGKLINEDTKIFINGSLVLTDTDKQCKVQIGSPTGNQYSLIPVGGINKQVNGIPIFKQIYVRKIPLGSLIGEY